MNPKLILIDLNHDLKFKTELVPKKYTNVRIDVLKLTKRYSKHKAK